MTASPVPLDLRHGSAAVSGKFALPVPSLDGAPKPDTETGKSH
jgi:hypothetical protein